MTFGCLVATVNCVLRYDRDFTQDGWIILGGGFPPGSPVSADTIFNKMVQ